MAPEGRGLAGWARKVAVLRALQLGDLLVAVPALRALRAALPAAEITLIGLPWARGFVERFSRYLDDFVELPGWPGLPERILDVARIPAFLADMQARQFDLVLQMHGAGSLSNPLAALLGGRVTAGYFRPGELCPAADWYLPYPSEEPEIRRHLRLMRFLGVEPRGEDLEYPLSEQDRQELRRLPETQRLQRGGYAVVHAGARALSRRWPPERFAAVADALVARGLRIVLTGTKAEAEVVRAVGAAMRAPHVNLAGKTSLGALGALVQRARLVVSNDTGVMHVADALRVPSVILFGGPEPHIWGPFDRQRHRVLVDAPSVQPEAALEQVDDLLREPPVQPPEAVHRPIDESRTGGLRRANA
jgi:ADP-heptose:LPS heptosyltransferase